MHFGMTYSYMLISCVVNYLICALMRPHINQSVLFQVCNIDSHQNNSLGIYFVSNLTTRACIELAAVTRTSPDMDKLWYIEYASTVSHLCFLDQHVLNCHIVKPSNELGGICISRRQTTGRLTNDDLSTPHHMLSPWFPYHQHHQHHQHHQ